jgi:hypothetical protein
LFLNTIFSASRESALLPAFAARSPNRRPRRGQSLIFVAVRLI